MVYLRCSLCTIIRHEFEAQMDNEITLKLLRVIHTVVASGSVTEAAKLLNQSPGNISYQLRKAREATGAHLFIRNRDGMQPDATALKLNNRYEQYLLTKDLPVLLKEQRDSENFKINTFSLIEMLLSCNLFLTENNCKMPCYEFKNWESRADKRGQNLKNHIVDVDIGSKLPVDSSINAVELFTSPIVFLTKENTSGTEMTFGTEGDESLRHAIWGHRPDYYSDNVFIANKATNFFRSRNVGIVSSSMTNLVSLCANSDYVMTIPEVFVDMLAKNYAVVARPLPDDIELKYTCYLHYHADSKIDIAMLEKIESIVRKIT